MPKLTQTLNQLLAALPGDSLREWQSHLEEVDLRLGDVLYESGSTMGYAYFPTSAVISILSDLESGASAEIAVVGNEGVVGISIFMGDGSTSNSAVVLSAGKGYRLKAAVLRSAFNRSPDVMRLLLSRYSCATS